MNTLKASPNKRFFLSRRDVEVVGVASSDTLLEAAGGILAITDKATGAHVYDEVTAYDCDGEACLSLSRPAQR
jgi:hypothetical protein